MGEFYFSCKKNKVIKALKKLGFFVEKGAKHDLAKCIDNGGKTTIPRHPELKREIVESIAKFLIDKDTDKEKLLKLLR